MAEVKPFACAPLQPRRDPGARRRHRAALRRDRRRRSAPSCSPARPSTSSSSTFPRRPTGGDPYEHAAETLEEWTLAGHPGRRPRALDLGADPGLHGPRRRRPHPPRASSPACASPTTGPGLIRPHERTQPGPKEDRLRLTRATRHNLSPIFALHPASAWGHARAAPRDRALGRGRPTPTAPSTASGGSPTRRSTRP